MEGDSCTSGPWGEEDATREDKAPSRAGAQADPYKGPPIFTKDVYDPWNALGFL